MSLLSFFRRVLYPYRYWFLVQCINIFFWTFLSLVTPYVLWWLTDTLAHGLKNLECDKTSVHIPSIVYIMILFLWSFSCTLRDGIWQYIKPFLKINLVEVLMEHLMRQPLSFYADRSVGGYSNRVNEIAAEVPEMIQIAFDDILDGILYMALSVIAIVYGLWKGGISSVHSWLQLVVGGWGCGFMGMYAILYFVKIRKLNMQLAQSMSLLIAHIIDMLNNVLLVKLFNGYQQEADLVHPIANRVARREQNRDRWLMLFNFFQGIFFALLMGASLYKLIVQFKVGNASVGDFSFLLTLGATISDKIWAFNKSMGDLTDKWGYIEEGLAVILSSSSSETKKGQTGVNVVANELIFENISLAYGDRSLLFNQFDLKISGGQRVIFFGESGGGKSSCIRLLLRFCELSKGRILLDGIDIASINVDQLRQVISVVPQRAYLFSRSIIENIRYGRPNATDEELFAICRQVGLDDFIRSLPRGYDTKLVENGENLSGGQKKRLAIARALLKQSPILILDEPYAHLDQISRDLISNALSGLPDRHCKLLILVTHMKEVVKKEDRVLVFDGGKIVADLSGENFLKKMNCSTLA